MMEMGVLWNIGLSALTGTIGWFLSMAWSEIQRVQILLNRTREEMAKDYVTKDEVRADMTRVIDRLESLDAKLDRLMERSTK
jgi:hypothetical protein